MPAWNKKDARQYEHVKESAMEKGVPEELATEIAARTVNKHRRQEGRTPNKTTQGTGNPRQPLENHTRDELYNQAKLLHIQGRSNMNKKALITAIRAQQ
jgi:hypothetical protein